MDDNQSLRRGWREMAEAAISLVEEWSGKKAPAASTHHVMARNLWRLVAIDGALKEDEPRRAKLLAVMEFARARALDAAHGDTSALVVDGAPDLQDPRLKALVDPALHAELRRMVVGAQPHLAALGALEADAAALANRLRVMVEGNLSGKDPVQMWALGIAEVLDSAFAGTAELATALPIATSLFPREREKLKPRLLIGLSEKAVEDELTRDMAWLNECGVSLTELAKIFFPKEADPTVAKNRIAKRLQRLREPGVDKQ